jgi:hypothetical membrane protein
MFAPGLLITTTLLIAWASSPITRATAGGLTGGAAYVILSFLTYGVITLFPAKDERNLSYSYLVFILLSAVVMYILFRMNKRAVKQIAV